MKMRSISTVPTSLFVLVCGLPVATATFANKGNISDISNEKRNAAEYWAEFTQDDSQTWQDAKAAFRDGWIESKAQTALSLNEYLSKFALEVRVDKGIATLNGGVHSSIERELAENIVRGAEGIDSITNNLKITEPPSQTPPSMNQSHRTFAQYVADVSTTATIKIELQNSPDVEAHAIEVDTLNHKVILTGQVRSLEEKALAQAIAAKQGNVKGVTNNLQVTPSLRLESS